MRVPLIVLLLSPFLACGLAYLLLQTLLCSSWLYSRSFCGQSALALLSMHQ